MRPREKTPHIDEFKKIFTWLKTKKYRRDLLKEENCLDFIKINNRPLLKNLDDEIESYTNKYSEFLFNNTNILLGNIKAFQSDIAEKIKEKPKEGDKELL